MSKKNPKSSRRRPVKSNVIKNKKPKVRAKTITDLPLMSADKSEGLIGLYKRLEGLFRNPIEPNLGKAMAVLVMYPLLREDVEKVPESEGLRYRAKFSLDCAHRAAAGVVAHFAELEDIDSTAIYESAQVCRDLTAIDPWVNMKGPRITWPECLGEAIHDRTESERAAIRKGDAIIHRINTRYGLKGIAAISPPENEHEAREKRKYTMAELRTKTGYAQNPLSRFIDLAGIRKNKRGEKNRTFTQQEVELVLQYIINNGPTDFYKDICAKSLNTIRGNH